MKHLSDNTVELDHWEQEAKSDFEDYLSMGKSIAEAAKSALEDALNNDHFHSDEFVKYLSEGTVEWVGYRIIT